MTQEASSTRLRQQVNNGFPEGSISMFLAALLFYAAMLFAMQAWQLAQGLMLLALTVAAVIPPVRLIHGAKGVAHGKPARWLTLALNLVALYLCLQYFSTYNNLLIFGVWLMTTTCFLGLFLRSVSGAVRSNWIMTNLLLVAAILLAIPDVNGIHLVMSKVRSPTKVGIYALDKNGARLNERTQHFHHVHHQDSTKTTEFRLHSPVSGNSSDAVRLLLKPHHAIGFGIVSLELMNYLGFDSSVIERFDRSRFEQIELLNPSAGRTLTVRNNSLAIGPARKHVWLKIPIDTGRETRAASVARRNHMIRAIIYWQLFWSLFLVLAPVDRPSGVKRS